MGNYVQVFDLKELKTGDIIKHKSGDKSYVVTVNYGARVTAVTTVDVTNPVEWDVLRSTNSPRSPEQQ